PVAEPIDFAQLLERCVENQAVAIRVLQKFHAAVPTHVETIASAVARSEAEALNRAAHLLRGMAANVGATKVAQVAEAIEASSLSEETVTSETLEELRSAANDALKAATEWLADRDGLNKDLN